MTSEREERISGIFTAARELTGDERAAFLAEACTGDEELRHEVEELLAAEARAADFLEQPLSALAADLFTASPAPSSSSFGSSFGGSLPTDRLLGRYRILSRLGIGGMGEVFLAEDTQLDRRVAIKLLPAEFTSDSERVRRFIREAKAASALNHPNILTVYEIGEVQTDAGKLHCIVTEYVDGQTLRARMSVGEDATRCRPRSGNSSRWRSGRRARGRDHSPRHQTRKPHAPSRRLRQAAGLRPRQADRTDQRGATSEGGRPSIRRFSLHRSGHSDGHGALYVAGTGAWTFDGCAH